MQASLETTRSCPHCATPYRPGDYDANATTWLCTKCRKELPQEEVSAAAPTDETPSVPDARLRHFCDAQRDLPPLNVGLHMPALAAAYIFWMSGHPILAFVAAGVVEAITLAIATASRNAMNQAFVYRGVKPRPYQIQKLGKTINAQLVDVQGDVVSLRVTQDKYGTKGNVETFSKTDLSAQDNEYVTSVLAEVEKQERASAPPTPRTPEEEEAERVAKAEVRQAELRHQEQEEKEKERERLSKIAATLSPSERMCPSCGAKYKPADYSPDASEWRCSACKSVLPR